MKPNRYSGFDEGQTEARTTPEKSIEKKAVSDFFISPISPREKTATKSRELRKQA